MQTATRMHVKAAIGEVDFGNWEPGKLAMVKVVTQIPKSIELIVGGVTIWKLDPRNRILETGGRDRLAARRRSLGLTTR